jgi:hypothetical protein
MRIRTIKPEFWSHPVLSRLPDGGRLAAIGLLNLADDAGYFLADPALIRSALWPFDEDSSNARRALDDLSKAGYIEVRDSQTHGPIGLVVNFLKHQKIDRPSPSKLASYYNSTSLRRGLAAGMDQGMDQGTGNCIEHTHSAAGGAVELPPGFPTTAEEAERFAASVGAPAGFATKEWHQALGRGGRDWNDVPIRRWAGYVQACLNHQKSREARETANGKKPSGERREIKETIHLKVL